MKTTFTRLMAAIVLAIVTLPAAFAADIVIKFLRPADWAATPHVHVYCATGDVANNQEMTPVAGQDGWYSYEIKDCPDGYNVMFNNGGWEGGQSAGDMYEATAGNYAYTLDDAKKVIRAVDPTAASVTIRFKLPADWSGVPNIHIYHAVEGGSDVTDVNSTPMTAVAGEAGWYSYVFQNYPDNYNVMFNIDNWAKQVGPYFEEQPGDASFEVVGGELQKVGSTGIDAVGTNAPEAPAEYFDLNGIRVDNPRVGIFIRRQGSSVTKVIIR